MVEKIIELLKKEYPEPGLELEFQSPFQLLVEAILAAQESDSKVNSVTRDFFTTYDSPGKIARAPLEELEEGLSSINFYKRKVKLLKECCQQLVGEYGGGIPDSVEELVRLHGVGRKTANMVLGGALGHPAIIVDRHVMRVSRRIGLSKKKTADSIEKELRKAVPREEWTLFSLLLLNHGKKICTAKEPGCRECVICKLCISCGRV